MTEEIKTKICTKCGLVKLLDEFWTQKSCSDGKRPSCILCDKEAKKYRYQRDKINGKIRRPPSPESKIKIAAYQKVYRLENHEEIIAAGYIYRAGRKDKTSEASKTERRTRPEVHIFRGAKKRAKKSGIPFSIEKTDIIVPSVCPILGIPLDEKGNLDPFTIVDFLSPETEKSIEQLFAEQLEEEAANDATKL